MSLKKEDILTNISFKPKILPLDCDFQDVTLCNISNRNVLFWSLEIHLSFPVSNF